MPFRTSTAGWSRTANFGLEPDFCFEPVVARSGRSQNGQTSQGECDLSCCPPGQWWPEEEKAMGHSEFDPAAKERRPWNAGRTVGAKRAVKPQQVWAIRFWLDRERRLRDRALFDLAIDSKLRGCDVVKVRIGELVSGGRVR